MRMSNVKRRTRILALVLVLVEILSLLGNVAYGTPGAEQTATATSLAETAADSAAPGTADTEDIVTGEETAESAPADGETTEVAPDGETAEQPLGELTEQVSAEITTSAGYRYTVTVAYGDAAGLPEGVALRLRELTPEPLTEQAIAAAEEAGRPYDTERFVSAAERVSYRMGLTGALAMTGDELELFTDYLDLELIGPDGAVQPQAPVEVTVVTDAVEPALSDAVELVMLTQTAPEDPAEKPETDGAVLAAENLSRAPDAPAYDETGREIPAPATLRFSADTLTTLGLMALADKAVTEQVSGVDITLYAPRQYGVSLRELPGVGTSPENDVLLAFRAILTEKTDDDTAEAAPVERNYAPALWLTAEITGQTPKNWGEGGLSAFRADENGSQALFGASGAAVPVRFCAGDAVTVLWDTGLRSGTLQSEHVTLDGLMPPDAAAVITDVTDTCDAAVLTGERHARTMAAYDIRITADGETYLPDETRPVTVTLYDDAVLPGKDISVWHVTAFGTNRVEDCTVSDGKVTFTAGALGTYLLVNSSRETTVTAGDGHTYEIAVTYLPEAGIPDEAVLSARELTGREYSIYYQRAQGRLGMNGFAAMRAFDISFLLPDGTVAEPQAPVNVTIRMLDSVMGDTRVVHFGRDGTEVIDPDVSDGGATLDFTTDSFSVYALVGSKAFAYTYIFYVPDEQGDYGAPLEVRTVNGNYVNKQTVKSVSELVIPQLPDKTDEVFVCWYEGTYEGGVLQLTPYDFAAVKMVSDEEIHLYAVFAKTLTATFYDQFDPDTGTFPVMATVRVVKKDETSAQVNIKDMAATYRSSGSGEMAHLGWSLTPITTPGAAKDDNGDDVDVLVADDQGEYTITEDTKFYPVFKPVRCLTFYTAQSGLGASYVAPKSYFETDRVTKLPGEDQVTRKNYHFAGWYTGKLLDEPDSNGSTVEYFVQITDKNGALVVSSFNSGGISVSSTNQVSYLSLYMDATLYAKWEADYRIEYYTQDTHQATSIPDEQRKWDYAGTLIRQAEVGKTVQVEEADKTEILSRLPGYMVYDQGGTAVIGNTEEVAVLKVRCIRTDEEYTPTGSSHTLTFRDPGGSQPIKTASLAYGAELKYEKPEDPTPQEQSENGREIYEFNGWYLDEACTIPADLETMTMPDRDLTLYAGWAPIWFVVKVDPDYGTLPGSGSTWFWKTYFSDTPQEYTQAKRDYVESSSGEYYYVKHDRAYYGYSDVWTGGESNVRDARYTDNPKESTENTTFEYMPGVYSYIGTVEVLADGSEVPYTFGTRVDHNTTLRLKWKKSGTYYLAYDAGEGHFADDTQQLRLDIGFADCAAIQVTKAALPMTESGKTFVGWRVEGGSTIYKVGDTFTLHAEDARRMGGKDVVVLHAVYVQADTATLIYDANGGTVNTTEPVDFGRIADGTTEGAPITVGGDPVAEKVGTTQLKISNLVNNTRLYLSSGVNFIREGFTLAGWSDIRNYNAAEDPDGEHFFPLYDTSKVTGSSNGNPRFGVDSAEPRVLYAVWQTTVTYKLNNPEASWVTPFSASGTWDAPYTPADGNYTVNVYDTNAADVPPYIPSQADGARMFRYWAIKDGDTYTKYDFAQPVTGALDLYAYWSAPEACAVHAVDASDPVLKEKSDWVKQNVTVGPDPVDLTAAAVINDCVSAPASYVFAFVALSASKDSITEADRVTAIKFDTVKQCYCVQYADSGDFTPVDGGKELYFVYYQTKTLPIAYKHMASSGELLSVTAAGAPVATGALGSSGTVYSVDGTLTTPLAYVDGGEHSYTHYAYAIGSADEGDGYMNASKLSLITDASGNNGARPQLAVRNTWRGFRYSTDNGASWVSCGYAPTLYLVYFEQQPTVIMFREKTVATQAVRDAQTFNYHLVVTQTVTVTHSVQTQVKDGDNWVNDGDPVVTTDDPVLTTAFDSGSTPYTLKNGEASSAILFFSTETQVKAPEEDPGDENKQTVETVTTVTTQTAALTQQTYANFTTSVSENGAEPAATTAYTYTAAGTEAANVDVTFTNTHKSIPLEIHVARVQSADGGNAIFCRDDLRSTSTFTVTVPMGTRIDLAEKLSAYTLYPAGEGEWAYGMALSAPQANNGQTLQADRTGVVSVEYRQVGDSCEPVLLDGQGNSLGVLGDRQLYYLYYKMPRIRYVKREADGSLTDITSSLPEGQLAYNHLSLEMNGQTVVQNQGVEIPVTGLTISQVGNHFRMPPVLDDGSLVRYLGYTELAVGGNDVSNISQLDARSKGMLLYLRIEKNALEYSLTGQEDSWTELSLSSTPTIYAIYEERGYDLQIIKTVDTTQSGSNPLFTDGAFTVTITSAAITKESYPAEGAESDSVGTVSAGEAGRSIVLTMHNGDRIKIKGLTQGEYTIQETDKDNFDLLVTKSKITGGMIETVDVDKDTASLTLENDTKVELTNSPRALCRIKDEDSGEHIFYTMQSAVDYVEENIPSYTATIEMLSSYIMRPQDTMEIPEGLDITLVSQEDPVENEDPQEERAIINRTAPLADKPLITNYGSLTIRYVVLEGGGEDNVVSSAPVILNRGNLTLGDGALVCNAVNTGTGEQAYAGKGGAIYGTAGNITLSGTVTGARIENCSAIDGGAICYTGNGTITVSEKASIGENTATTGNGGAIHATGTIVITGSRALEDNCAPNGNGGAIYTENAAIRVEDKGGVKDNCALNGGAVYAVSATVSLAGNDGEISGNKATAANGCGGAIRVGSGSVTAEGGTLKDNHASTESGNAVPAGLGGAIYTESASVSLTGATVQDNSATSGGAVYTVSGGVTVGSNCTVTRSTATTGDGGAVYTVSGNVTVSSGTMTANKAQKGKGGAIYNDEGNTAVTGGATLGGADENQGNTANMGGAIYARTGNVTVSGSSILEGNSAKYLTGSKGGQGGAVCATTGSVTVTDGSILQRNRADGDGGAICTDGGMVELSSATLGGDDPALGNTTLNGNGGAVCTTSGSVTITDGVIKNNSAANSAKGNGGAVYTTSGSVTMSASEGNSLLVQSNHAAGSGGAVAGISGSVELTNVTLGGNADALGNTADGDGGAIYMSGGAVFVTGGTAQRNSADNGGVIYTDSGNVTLSGVSMSQNSATAGNGGAVADITGNVTLTGGTVSMTGNSAISGLGGVIYLSSGSVELPANANMTGNSAINGAAVFVNTGRATFTGGNITGNTATNGGAIGVGSPDTRLYFSGKVFIKDNKMGTADSNIYLDQDADDVINFSGLDNNARLGIYVPDTLTTQRNVPGATFAAYSSGADKITKITVLNDRDPGLFDVVTRDTDKKAYWGKSVIINVRYLNNTDYVAADLPKGTSTDNSGYLNSEDYATKAQVPTYYPTGYDVALSALAEDVSNNNTLSLPAGATYGGAFMEKSGAQSYGDDARRLVWDVTEKKWTIQKRNGTEEPLTTGTIYLYYAKPAYLSIENNSEDLTMNVTSLTVKNGSGDRNVVCSEDNEWGYGYVYARNGAVQSALLPVSLADLILEPGQSIHLLIPGAQGKSYSMAGNFGDADSGTLGLRLNGTPYTGWTNFTSNFTVTNKTLNSNDNTYKIVLGEDRAICKIETTAKVIIDDGEAISQPDAATHDGRYEYRFSTLKQALDFGVKYSAYLPDSTAQVTDLVTGEKTNRTAKNGDALKNIKVEMLVDYLLPKTTGAQKPDLPRGFDITLTTAKGGKYEYKGGDRVTISRDSNNDQPMLEGWFEGTASDAIKNQVSLLHLENLIFDGKSVVGNSNGGALRTRYFEVFVDNVDFKNIYAQNGGGLFVFFDFFNNNVNANTIADTHLEVRNSHFTDCRSTKKQNRLGGGAIATNTSHMLLENCTFTDCQAEDQAGAVFHRVDLNGKNIGTYSNVVDCTFTNCRAKAAGGLELDSRFITVTRCTFERCIALERNGGGFNIYVYNADGGNPAADIDCWSKVTGCTFNGCQITSSNGNGRQGGGFRSNTLDTTVTDCVFTNNTTTKLGGGIAITGNNCKSATIKGSTFTGCTAAEQGGAIYSVAKVMTIQDSEISGNSTQINSCSAVKEGGGVYHNNKDNAAVFTITNATIRNCQSNTGGAGDGGAGVYTYACKVRIDGANISGNISKKNGGGVYAPHVMSRVESDKGDKGFSVTNSTISKNTAVNGAGIYCSSDDSNKLGMGLTVSGGTMNGNTATGSGGAIYTNSGHVVLENSATISNNTATSHGGGVYQDNNGDGSELTVQSHASISGCRTTTNVGGGVRTNALTVKVQDASISRNTAKTFGGGLYYEGTDAKNSLTVDGGVFDANAAGKNGGGIYAPVNSITVQNNSQITNNTAEYGGGVYHNYFQDSAGNQVTFTGSILSGNTAKGGGGLRAGAKTLTLTALECKGNTATTGEGGGVWYDDTSTKTNRAFLTLTVRGGKFEDNSTVTNGGGIYTYAKTMTVEKDANDQATLFNNCSAKIGGGYYHNYDQDDKADSITTLKDCTVQKCTAANHGGGLYDKAGTLTLESCTIRDNTAANNGGGVCYDADQLQVFSDGGPNLGGLWVNGGTITGNTAKNGGGIWTKPFLWLYNGVRITRNKLNIERSSNAAGVYMNDNATLVIGRSGVAGEETIVISDNTTAGNNKSNVRLWGSNPNNARSVYVYQSLSTDSLIGVVNAGTVDAQFGTAADTNFKGFSDDSHAVFQADRSTLHGIYRRTDVVDERDDLVWAGPPIAKITGKVNGQDVLLYINSDGTDPAIFDKLDTGAVNDTGITGAFNLLRAETLNLYYRDETGNFQLYTGTQFSVKLLKENFIAKNTITVNNNVDRKITLCKAGTTDAEYPYEGKNAPAKVSRGMVNAAMITVTESGNLTLEDVILDSSDNTNSTYGSARCIEVSSANASVTLGHNAILQNANIGQKGDSHGGAVKINRGSFTINGGTIRNCSADGNGGAVYVVDGRLDFKSGAITRCTAGGNGGGVMIYKDSAGCTMGAGCTISDCSAGGAGGGVYVDNKITAPFHMTGGTIVRNHAVENGGGIYPAGVNSRLYFSGKVNVSGNTCDASKLASKICNVQLDYGFDLGTYNQIPTGAIIHTEGDGLKPGAYIGVYVSESTYDNNGLEKQHFALFDTDGANKNLYSFVNDRNGLKGGLLDTTNSYYRPHTIYWIRIFSLKIVNTVEASQSIPKASYITDQFDFSVTISGHSSSPGQLNAVDIDSRSGEFGDMFFIPDAYDSTRADFTLGMDEENNSKVAQNISAGLSYTVTENLAPLMRKKYAPMPVTYTVGDTLEITGSAGEFHGTNAPDEYTSLLTIVNVLPACKITDDKGNLLYRAVKVNEGIIKTSTGESMERIEYVPAVYTELTGEGGAFQALTGTLYSRTKSGVTFRYDDVGTDSAVQIQMLINNYKLLHGVALPAAVTRDVTLTTASKTAADFPYRDSGTTASIVRSNVSGSMITMNMNGGSLTLKNITLNGENKTQSVNGAIVCVNRGKLTITDGATLRGGWTSANGGAVYAATNATVEMNGGTVRNNGCTASGNGAGIYVSDGATLKLSGTPTFAGTSNTAYANRNYKDAELKNSDNTMPTNGPMSEYDRGWQDIYLAGKAASGKSLKDLEIAGALQINPGSIWVWAAESDHYQTLKQFAVFGNGVKKTLSENGTLESTLKAFRDARTDEETKNEDTSSFLTGFTEEDLNDDRISWSGMTGKRLVILRKVNDQNNAVYNAEFILYRGNSESAYVLGGVVQDKAALKCSPTGNGVFFVGELPYGTYWIKEYVPSGYHYAASESGDKHINWFELKVNKDGFTISGAKASRTAS